VGLAARSAHVVRRTGQPHAWRAFSVLTPLLQGAAIAVANLWSPDSLVKSMNVEWATITPEGFLTPPRTEQST
jgi:hypothetical protein